MQAVTIGTDLRYNPRFTVNRKGMKMKIAVTGGTGFLGRYIVNRLLEGGHSCRCWYRPASDRTGFVAGDSSSIEWVEGALEDADATVALVRGVDAVIHAGVHWMKQAADVVQFAQYNIVGTVRLMAAAKDAGAQRFIFISSCALHEVILDDRPLDEAHPLWPMGHYGAYKAAVEKYVHSFGLGEGWNACSVRPTGIYGLTNLPTRSRWFDIVRDIKAGNDFQSAAGGKEVHASDVAKACDVLLHADPDKTRGQAFNCYDRYVAQQDIAQITKDLTGSASRITVLNKGPKHQIDTTRIQSLGMRFGGRELLEKTIAQLVDVA